MLTNWGTISGSIKKMKKYEADLVAENRGFTKKELLKMSVKKDKLERALGGIAEMKKVPDLVFIIDTNYESLAIKESRIRMRYESSKVPSMPRTDSSETLPAA